ncbi:hypothetical protein OG523_07085 [Streptomyces virginiae]|nr:hypothetical protein [Streptomyces virginiae]MCX4956756.1 hypothetical protein [Streptomyces virginiae]
MSAPDLDPPLTPPRAAWPGLPPAQDRRADVAAAADHILAVVSLLRELDFGETPPSTVYRAGGERHDAAV